jgi:citrate lyase subunit beta/citryl-CoA lyase
MLSQNLTLTGTETTALFVPGDRPDRFLKAQSSGAGCIIIDLEDAVADENKTQARDSVFAFVTTLGPGFSVPTIMRVNPVGSPHLSDDADLIRRIVSFGEHALTAIMLAKAESPADVATLRAVCGASIPIIPLIETARGVLAARDIAETKGVERLAFGAIDYALDVGCSTEDAALLCARSHLVMASRAASVLPPWDSPSAEITNEAIVRASAEHARMLGFGGKLCIHPSQVGTVARAFVPSDQEREWALRVLSAGAGASKVDGTMVDRPVIARARVIIEQSEKVMSS